jgi:hypothetical protein
MKYKCSICNKKFDENEIYEYRGMYSCSEHFEEMEEKRNLQRQEIINEEHRKTKDFKGLDLSDSTIGKANRKILRSKIEIASKESVQLKEYEDSIIVNKKLENYTNDELIALERAFGTELLSFNSEDCENKMKILKNEQKKYKKGSGYYQIYSKEIRKIKEYLKLIS